MPKSSEIVHREPHYQQERFNQVEQEEDEV
jgi:hypothetical protein